MTYCNWFSSVVIRRSAQCVVCCASYFNSITFLTSSYKLALLFLFKLSMIDLTSAKNSSSQNKISQSLIHVRRFPSVLPYIFIINWIHNYIEQKVFYFIGTFHVPFVEVLTLWQIQVVINCKYT